MYGCGVRKHSPRIGKVLQWQPPDVHICGTDPSLINVKQF